LVGVEAALATPSRYYSTCGKLKEKRTSLHDGDLREQYRFSTLRGLFGRLRCRKRNIQVNERPQNPMPAWLPFLVGGLLVVQFAGLGIWQINRGLEKRSVHEAFSEETGFAVWSDGMQIHPYQRLKATGHFDGGRQFLLNNIILNDRYGHYVLTPLVGADGEPVLIVNRGWLEKPPGGIDVERIHVDSSPVVVRGRAGSLPGAGTRIRDSIAVDAGWPRHAVFPTLTDLEAALGQDLQPFVLLMDPQEAHGFLRHWVPEEMGPNRHFGYAFQWFAMGTVLASLLIWHYRRRALPRD
jgi:surfeit locus 1 family protein